MPTFQKLASRRRDFDISCVLLEGGLTDKKGIEHGTVQKGQRVVNQALKKEEWTPAIVGWCREFELLKKVESSLFLTFEIFLSKLQERRTDDAISRGLLLFPWAFFPKNHSESSLRTHRSQRHGEN